MRRLFLVLLLPFFMTLGHAASSPLATRAWKGLSTAGNNCPNDYDYFPAGGMRNFWCHLNTLVSLSELEAAAGVPIFLSGPQSAMKQDLNNPGDFGHYNPAFVAWVKDNAIPEGEANRRKLQPVYDTYIQPLARVHWVVWVKMQAVPKCTARELQLYQQRIQLGTSNEGTWGAWYERWFYFMNPEFCKHAGQDNYLMAHGLDGGWSGNVVKTAVGFWLRRSLDGTAVSFAQDLESLLQVFDPVALSQTETPRKH